MNSILRYTLAISMLLGILFHAQAQQKTRIKFEGLRA